MKISSFGKSLVLLMGIVVAITATCDVPTRPLLPRGTTNPTAPGSNTDANPVDSTDSNGSGRVRLLLGDRAFPFDQIEEACVYISRIEFRRGIECEEAADCTGDETCMENDCIDGTCVASPKDCNDDDACTNDSCDTATGDCLNEGVMCEDGQICVDGDCAKECMDATECDDSDLCTDDDCVNEACVHTSKDCSDLDACTNDSCDATTGDCVNEDVMCEDGHLCVDGECAKECTDAEACDDSDPCTDDDCVGDLCVNAAMICDDEAFCNGEESCDPDIGTCVAGENPCAEEDTCDEDNDICDTDDGDDGDDSPFVVVFTSTEPMGTKFNLLELQNGTTALLADAVVPAGFYTQVRVIIVKGEISLIDDRTLPLTVPSGQQSGIKLRAEFEVEDGSETTLLLHVDVTEAFVPIPGGKIDDVSTIRNFHFRPSLAMEVIDLGDAGSISGTATMMDELEEVGLENVTVSALVGTTAVRTTSTEADGTYELIGLLAGTYEVEFSKDTFDKVTVSDVSVNEGQETPDVDALLSMTP